MISASNGDWPKAFKVSRPMSLDWLEAFDRHINRKGIRQIIEHSDPSIFSNDYIIYCCELGAVIGEAMIKLNPGLNWMYDRP
jgi:hypothetical protein